MKLKLIFLFISFSIIATAQVNDTISETEVSRIISFLAADSLKGRANYTPELQKAAEFIAREFEKVSLQPYQGSYYQSFTNLPLSKRKECPIRMAELILQKFF